MVPAASLHLRACRWFNAQGLLDEAVEQALRAGHLDVAANLVQNLSEEQLLAEQNVGMLLRWKMDLPDSLLISTPRLIVLYSWALGLACQLDAAEELASHLSRFLPAPSATAQKSMLAQWLALSGIIARGRGNRELTLLLLHRSAGEPAVQALWPAPDVPLDLVQPGHCRWRLVACTGLEP